MDDDHHQATPPPDEAFLASVPPEFSRTTTELELLLTDPAFLNSPPRYSSGDRNAKRVMFRIARYIELLRINDALAKRSTGELASTLRRLRAEIGPPPAFPFNDVDWHQWLLQPAPATLGQEEFFDLGPMPLPMAWDDHGPFLNSLDLIRHIDATWERAADFWQLHAQRELERAEKEFAREESARRMRDPDFVPTPAAPESTDRVLGHLNSVDVYLRDPAAPSLRRHCYFTSYALYPLPAPADAAEPALTRAYRLPDHIYIRTNVDYVPPLPSALLPILRTDGRRGPHEISRYPQWHEVGLWHHAFIPLKRRDGRAHKNDHADVASWADMAWYIPDFVRHYTECRPGFFRMNEELAHELGRAWVSARDGLAETRDKYPALVGQPYAALDMGRRAWDLLRTHQLSGRDIVEILANLQRCILEIRGWNEFVNCRMWLKRFQQRIGNPSILPPADARDEKTRRWARGVFTHSADIAMRYGQYGVPVFLVQVVKAGFVPPPTDFVPEGPRIITHFLRYNYAVHAWNDFRAPLHVAAVQEPGFVTHNEHEQQDDDDAVYGDDAPVMDDNDAVTGDDERPLEEDAVMRDRPVSPQNDDGAVRDRPANAKNDDDAVPRDDDDDVVMRDDAPVMSEVSLPEAEPVEALARPAVKPAGETSKQRKESEKKRPRSAIEGSSAGTATSNMLSKRRKGEASGKPAESSEKAEAESNKAAQVKMSFPYSRRRQDVPMPDWWPKEWAVATSAVSKTEGRHKDRLETLSSLTEFAVDITANPGRLVLVPILEHFMGRKDELKCSRMIGGWLKSRANRMRQFEMMPMSEVPRWSAGDWRAIVSNNVNARVQVAWARKLGFPMDPEPEQVVVEELPHGMPMEPEEEDPSSGQSSPTTFTGASGPPSTVPSTAPTTRAPSEAGFTDVYDSDEEEDMTRIDSEGRRVHPEHSCFVEVIDGRTVDGSFMAREDERYLKEPPGWRRKAPGQQRGYQDFRLFVEESHGEDGVLEFQRIGESRRTQYSDRAQFWDYEGGLILYFLDTVGQRRDGGEHITKPIRFLPMAGARTRPSEPRQLRLWPAQSFSASLYVPRDALGAVGSRARTTKFRLSDEDYATMYPGAPQPRARGPDEMDESSAPAGPSSTTSTAVVSRPIAQSAVATSSTTDESIAPTAPSSSASTAVISRHAAEPSAAATSTSSAPSSSTPPPVEVPPPAALGAVPPPRNVIIKSKADYWAAQGAVNVPKEGAATPLYELLKPTGTIFFNEHILPPFAEQPDKAYTWPTPSWRKLIMWDLAELTFRTAVFALDDHLRRTYPDAQALNEEPVLERQRMVCAIWGSTSFAPEGPSPLLDPNWSARVEPVRAFHRIVSTWPRTNLSSPPVPFAQESDFNEFEGAVWLAYAQTYSDYFSREPPVPLQYPDLLPWDNATQ